MSEMRRNLVKNKWVSIATDRSFKPNDFPIMKVETAATSSGFCPFCEGNESFTPPEIAAVRNGEEKPNSKGWLVRTIPNKFSAFNLEGELEEKKHGIYAVCNGLGQHEVIIETPEHGKDFHELDTKQIEMIITMFKLRYNQLAKDDRIKYIQIYKNRGLYAGASLGHSHSQIVALPFVPGENQGLPNYYQDKTSCLICDILKQELEFRERIISESEYFLVLCPYASRFSYETWIIPKRHTEHFGELTETEEKDLSLLCKKMSMAIVSGLENASYNFVINTAPVNSSYVPGYHWYMEFTPRLIIAAGVEIATGVYINPTAPEFAASSFREIFSQLNTNICWEHS